MVHHLCPNVATLVQRELCLSIKHTHHTSVRCINQLPIAIPRKSNLHFQPKFMAYPQQLTHDPHTHTENIFLYWSHHINSHILRPPPFFLHSLVWLCTGILDSHENKFEEKWWRPGLKCVCVTFSSLGQTCGSEIHVLLPMCTVTLRIGLLTYIVLSVPYYFGSHPN